MDLILLPPKELDGLWLLYGSDPEKLAEFAKQYVLARQLGPEQFGRLALLKQFCPDKVYRMGQDKLPDLVLESLGDLFVIKVTMSESDVCNRFQSNG